MAKHKYIETPEILWSMFEDYVVNVEVLTYEVIHPKLGVTNLTVKAPITMEGFKVYGHEKGFTLQHYIDNTDNSYSEYREIISRIKDFIFKHNFNRAAVGIFKEQLISKQLGLIEKKEIEGKHEVEIFKGIDLDVKS
jgi:hypothetical protein